MPRKSIMMKKIRTRRVSFPPLKTGKPHCDADTTNTSDVRKFPADCPYPACQAENVEQVERAKQEWEFTADLMPQLVCLVDEAGYIMRANRTFERWGLGKVAEVRGRKIHDLIHPDCQDANCTQKIFWETIPDMMGAGRSAECQVEDRVLGRHLHLSFQSHPSGQHASAKVQSRIGVVVVGDISDLKQVEKKLQAFNCELELRVEARTAELVDVNLHLKQEIAEHQRVDAELEKSREEFQLLIETMSEGLVICNNKGLISYINERFCEMLGHPRDEVIGHCASEYIEESSLAVWNQLTTKVKVGIVDSDELKLKRLKGAEVWVKISPSLLYDQNGEIGGCFAVVTDISDRIRIEHALRASKNQLRELSELAMSAQEKERQRVAAELHDGIGQTLSAVKFSVEAGIKHLYEQPSEESFLQLENVIPRIQDAIEEVRRISMALRPSILDDIGILATLTWFCRESANIYKDIRIQLQLEIKEECVPAQIKVAIFRIVQEAFNNTIKHSRAGVINIALKHTDAMIELNIEDNGIGIDEKGSGACGNGMSRGLGLTNMRERAEYSGGRYLIDSTNGKGTNIQVTWSMEKQ